MSDGQPTGGFVVSRYRLYPKPDPAPGSMPVIGYGWCACGRRFPRYRLPGRPPRRCLEHRFGGRMRPVRGVSAA